MQIGELASLAGCPVATVRYYEREGLLPAAVRNENNNYRQYNHSHLDRLTFIRHCRSLDMTHAEIRALLEARQQPDASCESINELIDAHLLHVQARMAELRALEAQLADLRSQCHAAKATRDCGILRGLDHPGDTAWRSPELTHSHVSGCHGSSDAKSGKKVGRMASGHTGSPDAGPVNACPSGAGKDAGAGATGSTAGSDVPRQR
ncbi:Cd(II)/Pb(II)-responsive transcriptional regulator [Vogesella fluminis]|uniref:HTH merR-type domain-containing protein n=1 Tax=Vogesella fluminis TaxID=1069161 RepID=A0ABQ3HFL9_9NEIS|nr:Cd(II)/Pb(II)-responsive transcriptional regulator [Vogesella fluminis]GHD81963.1 hypothetical protein GCM10011419_28800 [Vogesella fluminis]